MKIIEDIQEIAASDPNRTALIVSDRIFSYGELMHRSACLAGFLSNLEMQRHSRVVVLGTNSVVFVEAFYACQIFGAIYVPVSTDLGHEKIEYIINDVEPSMIILDASASRKFNIEIVPECCHLVVYGKDNVVAKPGKNDFTLYSNVIENNEPIEINDKVIDQDLACIIYTSGSTGIPKGIMLTHLNMSTAARSIIKYLEIHRNDRIACALPLTFDYGLYQYLMAHMTGALVLIGDFTFPLEFIERITKSQCNILPVMPSMINMIEKLGGTGGLDTTFINKITNTGAALHESHIERIRVYFPRANIFSMYGLTECKRISYLPPEFIESRPGSVGRGMPNQEIFLVDENDRIIHDAREGELVVRGSHVMRGYWKNQDETAKVLKYRSDIDGICLYTGDIFIQDEEGFLYFKGRKDEVIKSHGQKVSLVEFERKISALSGVNEVAAIAIDDEISGQAVILVISASGKEITEQFILRYCRDNLDKYMKPRKVVFMEEIPKNQNQKFDKLILNEMLNKDEKK